MANPSPTTSFTTPSTTRSHIVLTGTSRNSSFSMRIEDPKKSSSIASPATIANTTPGASPSPQLTQSSNSQRSSENIADDVSLRIMLEKVPQVRENFVVVEKLGEGTFSKVYKAVKRTSIGGDGSNSDDHHQLTPPHSDPAEGETTYALKYITPIVKPGRVAKEIRFLRDLQGQANVVPLLGCFFSAGHTILVMPIIEHEIFQDFFQQIDVDGAREYMRNLFVALNHVHRLGIVHRDIKPANILYHRRTGRFSLVDFGLSQTQKEIDATGFAAAGIAAGHGSLIGSRSAPPVRPGDPSRVRSNLSIRFTNDALVMQHPSNQPSKASGPSVCRRNLTATLTKLSPTKKSPVKSKRPYEELEVVVTAVRNIKDENKPQEGKAGNYESPVKRQRISGMDFIERVVTTQQQTSTVFTTPKTGGGDENKTASSLSLYVPETPVKGAGLRTPLGNRDSNQGGLCSTSIAPPLMNFGAFTTPTKPPTVTEGQVVMARTPVKGSTSFHHEKMSFIPETPPKTVQKNLIFASSAKSAFKLKENTTSTTNTKMSTTASYQQAHHQHISNNFSTPKTISYMSQKRLQQIQLSKRTLAPELANIGGHGGGNRASTTSKSNFGHQDNSNNKPCDCLEAAYICATCFRKPELNVPRAGTPGFRAPEILLRSTQQSAKLDIWSAGVIFASILSGRYPFFRCMDDMTCIAEIVTVFGSSRVRRAAAVLGKCLVLSGPHRKTPPVDLKALCTRLRASLEAAQPNDVLVGFQAPDSAYDLLFHLLDPNPVTRFSAAEALNHPFFREKGTTNVLDLIAD